MQFLKQSTAATVVLGPFVDSTDGSTAETALTVSQADIRVSKAGGAFAQTNNAAGATHMENGYYSVPLDATDTNTVGRLTVAVSESGALAVWREYTVLPANVYDSLVAGTDVLQADLTQIDGQATSGNNATLNLAQLNISNSSGSAIVAASTGGNGHGMVLTGNGSGEGLSATGGATGAGAEFTGGATNQNGIVATGGGSGAGARLVAGASGEDVVLANQTATTLRNAILTNGSITAAVIATGAIDSDAIAVSGQAAIANAVWDEARSGHATAGTFGEYVNATPVAGSITAAVIATGAIDADAVAADAVTEIQAGLATAASVAALNNLSAAQVNAEVLDVLNTDTFAQPTGVPAATVSLAEKIGRLYQMATSEMTVTATARTFYTFAGAALWKQTLADDGVTFSATDATTP